MSPNKRKPMTASHRREKNKNKSIEGVAGDNEDQNVPQNEDVIAPQNEDVIAPQTEIVMDVGDNERDGEADKERNNEGEIETEKEIVHEAETENEKEAGNDSEHGESIGTDDTAASSEDGSDDASNSTSDDGVLPPTRPELEVFEYGLYEGGYDHVSNHVKKKIDRGPLKCKQYTAKLLRWDLKRESKEMKQFVTNSCLHPLRESSYKTANRLLISLFVERWHPETSSFHMPFGEMTLTLDDVHKLLCLPIVGKPMTLPTKTYNETCEAVHKLLGIPLDMVNDELKKNRSMALRTQWLIANLSAASDTRLKVEPVQAARGYLLVLLGCTLFQDRTGDKVSAKYIYFLEDLDNISDWAWGAGTLAYTYHMLGKASMFKTKGIACYLTLIEAWIYEHFVNLRPGKAEKIHRGELLPKKWKGGSVMAEKNVYRNMKYLRLELDSMTKADVHWTPYRKLDEDPSDVVWFFGCLSLDNISEPYHPNRVVRQFGRVQSKPCAPIALKISSRKVSKTYVAKYDAKGIMFDNYEEYLLEEEARGIHAKEEGECTLEYEEWYTSVAITKLNFEMPSDLAGKRKKSSREGDVVQKAIGMLETYVAKGVKSTKEELLSGCSAVIKVLKGESCKGGQSLAFVETSRKKRSKNK